MPRSPYTRKGVEAAVRLAALDDPILWHRIEGQYGTMITEKGGEPLTAMEEWAKNFGVDLREKDKDKFITSDDLEKIVEWKFKKGKARPGLWKYLKSNSPASVQSCSRASLAKADKDDVDGSIAEMTKLKGVGAATASAILSFYKPELFVFMDDEVIECLHKGPRAYTEKIYLALNAQCTELASKLGETWTPSRVGRALWTAAKIMATGGDDLTLVDAKPYPISSLSKSIDSTENKPRQDRPDEETSQKKKRRTK
mmetsp:Transcript_4088/g.5352  ORF Transcript_4088/g.5352 Transcript_4088/m.5352 type:complete len:255 (-) Transcript_4088:99-863(-)